MIPQGMPTYEADALRDHRSFTNIPILITGIKLPADLSYTDKKLRTFASCMIPGEGQKVTKFDVRVDQRTPGKNVTIDEEIAMKIVETNVSAYFEEVTHYYLRR
jgi:hypothetical protein